MESNMSENLQPFEIQREALAERLKLKDQWASQVKMLNEAGVLELLPESQELGIIGIDGQEYAIPSYEQILGRITQGKAEILENQTENGYKQLILTPFAMPLRQLCKLVEGSFKKVLSENQVVDAYGSDERINSDNFIEDNGNILDSDINGEMVYYPNSDDSKDGLTKIDCIKENGGWEIDFIAKEPQKYIQDINKQKKAMVHGGVRGLTLESWLTQSMNFFQNEKKFSDYLEPCLLAGSSLREKRTIPAAWFADNRSNYKGKYLVIKTLEENRNQNKAFGGFSQTDGNARFSVNL